MHQRPWTATKVRGKCFSSLVSTLSWPSGPVLGSSEFAVNAAGFLLYVVLAIGVALVLIIHTAPRHGTSNVLVYVAICSLVGSLSVMSCKVRLSALLAMPSG